MNICRDFYDHKKEVLLLVSLNHTPCPLPWYWNESKSDGIHAEWMVSTANQRSHFKWPSALCESLHPTAILGQNLKNQLLLVFRPVSYFTTLRINYLTLWSSVPPMLLRCASLSANLQTSLHMGDKVGISFLMGLCQTALFLEIEAISINESPGLSGGVNPVGSALEIISIDVDGDVSSVFIWPMYSSTYLPDSSWPNSYIC